MISRRSFLQNSAAFLACSALQPIANAASAAGTTAANGPEISVFSKHFLGIPTEQMGEILAGLGVKGIEAPIRPGGHVEPAKVEDELPKFVETLKPYGVKITMLTSGINSVSSATHTEAVLRTAKKLGIPRFRMNWYTYDNKQPIWPQVDEIRPKLKDLVALSKEIGILPCYQNHSGAKLVGAGIWDMALLMRDYKVDELAWAFDIMHATIEGSTSWPTEFDLVRDRLGMAYFKNFVWEGKGHRPTTLAEGVVGRAYVERLKRSGFQGPVCLHVEYLPEGAPKDAAYLKQAVATSRADLATLREWWA
jgi:sugar phosphate isomerase/epimerase